MKRKLYVFGFGVLMILAGLYYYRDSSLVKKIFSSDSPPDVEYLEFDETETVEKDGHKTGLMDELTHQAMGENLRFGYLDDYAKNCPTSSERKVEDLAAYLNEKPVSDYERARVIFIWLTENIRYDDHAFNSGKNTLIKPGDVLKKKRAVCSGFTGLFAALGEKMGLEVKEISGYSKGYGFTTDKKFDKADHSWVAVKIDEKWCLIDPTWGEGYGESVNGALHSKKKFNSYWFDVDPNEMIFSHMPEEEEWQLQHAKISLDQFKNLPLLTDEHFKLGFNGRKALKLAMSGEIKEFPDVYSFEGKVTLTEFPYNKYLKSWESYSFTVESSTAADMALVQGEDWNYFEKSGSTFTLSIEPEPGELALYIKYNEKDEYYYSALEYEVKSSRMSEDL